MEYGYDGLGNVTAIKRWDYQPNGSFSSNPDWETDKVFMSSSAYLNANTLRLVQSATVRNSAGAQVAQTTYSYDENTVLASGVGAHLNTPPGPRGNLTSVKRWLGPNTPSVTSGAKWYDTGEMFQSIDPATNKTTYTYDSTFAGAYPTKICNALRQCSYNGYDLSTGLKTSFTDVNGTAGGDSQHTTTYTYDALFRPLCTTIPDGGQTCLDYPSATTVQKTAKITSSLNDISSVILDGLGRPIRTRHTTPEATFQVDTAYDLLGRVSSVSNPYFSTSELTYGVTRNQYDALGRITKPGFRS